MVHGKRCSGAPYAETWIRASENPSSTTFVNKGWQYAQSGETSPTKKCPSGPEER